MTGGSLRLTCLIGIAQLVTKWTLMAGLFPPFIQVGPRSHPSEVSDVVLFDNVKINECPVCVFGSNGKPWSLWRQLPYITEYRDDIRRHPPALVGRDVLKGIEAYGIR
jgi:hypothetical protein